MSERSAKTLRTNDKEWRGVMTVNLDGAYTTSAAARVTAHQREGHPGFDAGFTHLAIAGGLGRDRRPGAG
jgi:hypothetical protein